MSKSAKIFLFLVLFAVFFEAGKNNGKTVFGDAYTICRYEKARIPCGCFCEIKQFIDSLL